LTVLTRRGLLGGLAAGGLALTAGGASARGRTAEAQRKISVTANPLDRFDLRDRARRDFGPLRFLGGLALSADDAAFGGFSSLRMLAADGSFLALSDRATWFQGRIVSENGRPTGIADARLAPALDARGRPLARTRSYDTESMSFHDGALYVGVERSHQILRFDWQRHGLLARGTAIALPAEVRTLPRNRGLEALGSLPGRGAEPASLIAISERSGDIDAPTVGFLIGGRHPGRFSVARHDRFDITDLDVLPSGDVVLLERRFSWWQGVAMRLRRIPRRRIAANATLDGDILLTADMGYTIDNMEGLAIAHDNDGRLVLTVISDDNFSVLQRTLLLQFAYRDGA
jgi:hypothetical protein